MESARRRAANEPSIAIASESRQAAPGGGGACAQRGESGDSGTEPKAGGECPVAGKRRKGRRLYCRPASALANQRLSNSQESLRMSAILSMPYILGGLFLFIFLYLLARALYKKAGREEALIVYGRRKLCGQQVRDEKGQAESFRIVRGGGTFVWPAWESASRLSLKMMTLDIDLKHVYTMEGIPINVRAVAQVKIGSAIHRIRRAAEGFLGINPDHIASTIKETVAGHLRAIIATLTAGTLYRDQKRFQERVREEAHVDLEGMGFEFKSFVFQEIQDDEGYLNALGQPKIQEALKNARIATANADREARLEEEGAGQQKESKRLCVDTQIADSDKALSLKRASIKKEVDVATAQATKAGEMEMKVQDIKIAEQAVERRKLQLNAEIREQADARKFETERAADAEQYRIERGAAAARTRPSRRAQARRGAGAGAQGRGSR